VDQDQRDLLRELPAVGTLLADERVRVWVDQTSHAAVVGAIQGALAEARQAILSGQANGLASAESIIDAAHERLERQVAPSLVRVVNATGIVLHTGLGRACLSPAAVEALIEIAGGYSNLEYDLESGRRGKRQVHVAELLCRITGAEAATVVNNNAAATLLVCKSMAAGREIIVSRGQLVEIGGSYRLPDIMAASGAILREVGTTNRTRIGDYKKAVGEQTAAIMRVHTSNYRVVGFSESAPLRELVKLAHESGLVLLDDLGSGALFDLTDFGLPHEPVVADSIAAGADLVFFSGDKLLGGPQCGIICGRRELIEGIESDPLMRTYRVDKLTLCTLEATLREYGDAEQACQRITALRMLTTASGELAGRAEELDERLEAALPGESFLVCSDVSYAGGGSMPDGELETVVIQWRPRSAGAEAVAAAMRRASTPVVARIRDEAIIFDLRTIRDEELDWIVRAAVFAVEAS
jgi:L-seryl-tRNA(Ser) seleniumtransferase